MNTQWIKIIRLFFLLAVSMAVSIILIFFIFTYMLASGMNDGGVYTKDDFIKYHTLTEPEILNAPRISQDYYFEYHPGDGYPLSNSIIFNGETKVEPLKAYLVGLGYILRKRVVDKNEIIWESRCTLSQPSSFYLLVDYAKNRVQLEKEICD